MMHRSGAPPTPEELALIRFRAVQQHTVDDKWDIEALLLLVDKQRAEIAELKTLIDALHDDIKRLTRDA